jgi:signal transduction histidine kinase
VRILGFGNPRASRAGGGWLNKLTVLRLGFGGMIALLLFSALEAYRIQHTAAGQAAETYSRFVQRIDTITRTRRLLYLGSINVRDYLLSEQPSRLDTLQAQLRQLRAEAGVELDQLQRAAGPQQSIAELRRMVADFWTALESAPRRTRDMQGSQVYEFVQSEIVPRRNATGTVLRELTEVTKDALRSSEAEFQRSRHSAVLRILIMMGLCVLVGLAVARFSLRHAARLEQESVRRFEEVAQAKKDLEQLSARLLEIQEDERRRIARELHDEIGQTLTALRIEISRAQAAWKAGSAGVQDRLEEARSLAEKTVQTVRHISLLLRPALLDDLGLAAALQWHVEDFSRRSGIPCSYVEEALADMLPDAVRTCVYRVVQEALNNCEKHSAATQVRLAVRQSEGELAVEIEDNGRGFALDRQGGSPGAAGLGLLGMRERVAMLGGSLKLDSGEGRGTRVWLTLPLPAPETAVAGAERNA